jgi:glyoxylase-like metal-dependent hydrolase (beta-lactamase superfamily II)
MRQEQLEASEEVTEVAPGILRAQLPIMMPGLGHVNCYIIPDSKGVTLIDPGLPDPMSHDALTKRLAAAGIPEERIHTVLVTHSHPDHFGGAGRLRIEQGCNVIAHADFHSPFDMNPLDSDLEELEVADDGEDDLLDLDLQGLTLEDLQADRDTGKLNRRLVRVLFGTDPLPDIEARKTPYGEDGFKPGAEELMFMRSWDKLTKLGLLNLVPSTHLVDEQWFRMGDKDWQAVHTPGHTGDHLCLFEPESGVLLSGDHVLPTITPHISGMTASEDSLADFFAGLRRVAAMEGVKTVLPAHGLPFEDLPKRTDEIIQHHHERLDSLLDIAAELGEANVRAYSHKLFKERSWGPMAESETYAHLEHLRLLNKVQLSTDSEGKSTYELLSE